MMRTNRLEAVVTLGRRDLIHRQAVVDVELMCRQATPAREPQLQPLGLRACIDGSNSWTKPTFMR